MTKLLKNRCSVCGYQGNGFEVHRVINDELATAWGLSQKQILKFDLRESSHCPRCQNSARTRGLASAIIHKYALGNAKTLIEWVTNANKINLQVAEINSCGELHSTLSKLNHLKYSEYVFPGDRVTRVKNWLKGIAYQDIENLKYENNSFDLVLHSEVIEHVNDPQKALAECQRILKKNGLCIFTTPVIMNRVSRRRAKVVHNKTVYQMEPSFHGSGESDNLVFWEFGHDVINNWQVEIAFQDPDKELYVFSKKALRG